MSLRLDSKGDFLRGETIRPDPAAPSLASSAALIPQAKRGKRKVWLAAAILTLVLLGREGGFFTCYFYYLAAESHTHLSINRNEYHPTTGTLSLSANTSDSTASSKARHWGVSWPSFRNPDLSVDLAKEIEQQLRNEPQYSVYIKDIEFKGLYWLPLYKSGTCSYQIYFRTPTGISASSGELTGQTDFSVLGISAVRNLKIAVADEIAVRMRQNVKGALKK